MALLLLATAVALAGRGPPGVAVDERPAGQLLVVEPPAAPDTDWMAEAQERGAAGLYAARDAAAWGAFDATRDPARRVEALKLLADTAARVGDWSALDELTRWPDAPPAPCDCDALALHAAASLRRGHEAPLAMAWLAVIPPTSPSWADAQLLRAERDRPHAVPILEALVQGGPAGRARDRATLRLAALRCEPSTYSTATAMLDTLPASTEVALARAWCAVTAGRTAELPALLAPLDAQAGAWLPSLPLLHALADGGRPAMEAARAGYAAQWEQLDAAAAELAQSDDPAVTSKRVLTTLPPALAARIRTSDTLRGLDDRFDALARERARTKDEDIRSDLAAEREDADGRVATTLRILLEGHANEYGWLHEYAASRIATFDAPQSSGPELAARMRSLITTEPPRPERGAMAARLAFLELGRVPTESTIATLRTALEGTPSYPQRDRVAWTLALTLIDAGRTDEAERALTDLAARSPRPTQGWQAVALLGDIAFARRDFARADSAYLSATLAPDRELVLYATYRRAWCAWFMRQPKVAARLIEQVIADPATPAALRQHATAERRRLRRCPTLFGCW